jgi:hypothetical protein
MRNVVDELPRRHDIAAAPKRSHSTAWKKSSSRIWPEQTSSLCKCRLGEVSPLTYVLFFIQLETRRATLPGLTMNPTVAWMEQTARNEVDPETGHLRDQRYILHDRDTKFCSSFRSISESEGVKCLTLPARSPNLDAFAEMLGACRETRMSAKAGVVRRRTTAASTYRAHRAFSQRAKSSGEKEPSLVSFARNTPSQVSSYSAHRALR